MTDLEDTAMPELDGRVVAVIDAANGYDGLIAMFRQRIVELGTHMEAIESATKLPDGYVTKVLGPTSRRLGKKGVLGRSTLGPLMQALGVKLIVVLDENPIMRRLDKRVRDFDKPGGMGSTLGDDAGVGAGARKRRKGHVLRTKQLLTQSGATRRNIARVAAGARWQREREIAEKSKRWKMSPKKVRAKLMAAAIVNQRLRRMARAKDT